MAELETVQIKNFQSHRDTAIDLHPGVNVFIGQSHHGKSSVVRAMRWNARNDAPKGDFITHGQTECEVVLGWSDCDVKRRRTPSINEYQLDDQPLQGFRGDVPDSISDRMRLSELSWQEQHDTPFMLSETSGEVSRRLNKLANLEKIDTTLKAVNAMLTKAKRKMEDREAGAVELEEELKGFDGLDTLDAQIAKVELMEVKLREKSGVEDKLRETLNKARRAQEAVELYQYMDSLEKAVRHAEKKHSGILAKQEQHDKLERLVRAARRTQRVLDQTANVVKTGARVSDALRKLEALKPRMERRVRLETALAGCRKAQKRFTAEDELHNTVLADYRALVPEVCPTCNQPWPEEMK